MLEKIIPEIVETVGIKVVTDSDGNPEIVAHTTHQINSVEELIKEARIDMGVWEVASFDANVWHQMSTKNGLVPLWQAKAKFKRRELSISAFQEIFGNALKQVRVAKLGGKFKPCKTSNGKLVVIGVPDLHLGKLAWTDETGHGNYDSRIAKDVWMKAIDYLIAESPNAEECWLPLGSDFFNVDNDSRTTTGGTPQDEDGRWQKSFRLGVEMCNWAIARCRTKWPKVKVIMVYGNHDRQRSFYLGELLKNLEPYLDGVEVDNQPLDRKYYEWIHTGIGIAHGDKLREKDLAVLCQNEAREIWGRTRKFDLLLGHIHQPVVKSIGGVTARWLPALCPPDVWHSKHGYVTVEKGAVSLVYTDRGMVAQYNYYPDEADYE